MPACRGNSAWPKRARRCWHNDLRGRVMLQTDGGLKTGLDVIKAALLGADSFGFGTAPMIVLGCKYLRICHLNNCATGVATQDERLRANHFTACPSAWRTSSATLAEEVRGWLSRLGVRSLDEIVGRTDLLQQIERCRATGVGIDLSRAAGRDRPMQGGHCGTPALLTTPDSLATQLDARLADAIEHARGGRLRLPDPQHRPQHRHAPVRRHRAPARQSRHARCADHAATSAAPPGRASARSTPAACSWSSKAKPTTTSARAWPAAAWCVRPPRGARFEARNTPILGNTCLYGATGGELFAAGRAGERFAVRNSGAVAVVEGAGDHCCEYMTDGIVWCWAHRPELRRRLHRRPGLRAGYRPRFRRPLQPRTDRHPAHQRRKASRTTASTCTT